MEISTVPVHYVSSLLQSAQDKGLSRGAVLQAAGIGQELFNSDKARVPTANFIQLCTHLTLMLEDETCGLMRQRTKPGTFAMMCNASIHCPDLGHFLQRCYAFNALVTDCFDIKLHRDNEFAIISFTPEPGGIDKHGFLTMVLMSISHRLASWAIGQTLTLEAVNIERDRPHHAHEYSFLFMAPITFGGKHNELKFSARYLDLPIVRDEQELTQFLKQASMQLMANPDLDKSLVTKVRTMIKGEVSGKFPEFESVAESLHLTTATLRRRLRAEGSSYQQLKDDIRRDTAIFHLSRGTASMEEVAESVGFAEPTSFFRAFKRWTGVTPRAYISAGNISGDEA